MATLLLLLATVVATTQATCVREFFAQPVIYDRAMKIDFYYTGINQSTVAACAAFCGDRHFCRTAVYNTVTKTCAISYEYTLNCRYNEKRYTSFDLAAGINSHLIQVACVSKCNEETKSRPEGAQRDPPMLNSPGVPNVLKKVSLITAEPNDGTPASDDSTEVALPNYAALARARDPGYNAPNNNDIAKDEGYVNKLVIANISAQHDVIVNSYVKNGSQICYRRIQHKYLLGGSFQRHDGTTIIECRCLCAASYRAHILHRCQSFHWYNNGVCVLNKGSHSGKYDLIEDYQSTYEYVDCDVQVLLDVADEVCNQHENETTPATKDIRRTTPTKEKKATTAKPNRKRNRNGTSKKPRTKKNKQAHKGALKSTTVGKKLVVTTEAPTTTTKEENVTEKSTTTPASTTSSITTESPSTTITIESPTATKEEKSENENIAAHSAPDKVDPGASASETNNGKEEKKETDNNESEKHSEETPEKPLHREANSVTGDNTSTESTTTIGSSTTFLPESTSTVETTTTSETLPVKETFNVEQHGCFERIHGRMMESVAGGLEHDVSIEECQCLCANSRASGRYSFDCNSATYYHVEKDCVLNLDDRYQKKQLFGKPKEDYNVTYIGITCDRASVISSVVDASATYGCRKSSTPTTPKPFKRGGKGGNSDKCFVELPSFVLEGTAQQVETGITPQECKCLCAQSDERYGEGCQSFQYYFDSQTCLLNKLNRFSNPENFNFVPGTQPRSYFEFRCASLENKLRHYLTESCPNAKQIGDREHSTDEPDSREPETLKTPKPNIETETSGGSGETEPKKENRTWTDGEVNVNSEEKLKTPESSKEAKTLRRVKHAGKRKDPEISGEIQSEPKNEEDDPKEEEETNSEEEEGTETTTTTTTTTTEEPTTTTQAVKKFKKIKKRAHINRAIPEAEGLDDADFEEEMEVEVTDAPIKQTIQSDPIVNNFHQKRAQGVKTQKFTDKIDKDKIPLIETTVATTTTTEPTTTTTTTTKKPTTTTPLTTTTPAGPEYPSAGHCTYSALYQTQFQGRKMIKTVYVKNASDCFAACFVLRCRSASLVAQGSLNECILYHDSLIDYRNPNMLAYDRATVYFDGIRCDGKAS